MNGGRRPHLILHAKAHGKHGGAATPTGQHGEQHVEGRPRAKSRPSVDASVEDRLGF